ncbi:MAG TPA: dTDP-4-dehydrorhamnose 3,5-epimerase [Ilumatobacter sp.]
MSLVDFTTRSGAIDGLVVVTMKQVTDDRGTVRELFRRSAFEAAGVALSRIEQVNLTETSRPGAIRGMHAESMTKLVTVAHGRARGLYVDARPESTTFGVVDEVDLEPGVQVFVPPGVANGFQALTPETQYAYCFDHEWSPDMPGVAFNPLDPVVADRWPLPFDSGDPRYLSAKDRDAPAFAAVPR